MKLPWGPWRPDVREDPNVARLETWAQQRVHMGQGTLMLLEQATNKVLRHCAIGTVRKKAA